MSELSPQDVLEKARAAATEAQLAAEHAQTAAQQAMEQVIQLENTLGDAASAISGGAIDPFVFRLSIFVLAIFIGYFVVWSITPALHTPLMSVTNAISSVIIVGALLAVGAEVVDADGGIAKWFGFFGLMLAAVNIFGGFLVTQRMLAMYKKKVR